MRRLHMLSGSKLQLASICAWWCQPGVPESDVGPREERVVGTLFHSLVENQVNSGAITDKYDIDYISPAQSDEARELFEIWSDHYATFAAGDSSARCEVTYAFHPVTRAARELGANLGRKYEEAGLLPEEIPVTVDMVVTSFCAVVYDWKTGVQRHRKPIREHAQLRAGGFLAARAGGMSSAHIVVSYVTSDGVTEEEAHLDEFDFAAIEEELVALYTAATSQPEPRPGAHCADMWCSAITSCPASLAARDALDEGAKHPATAIVVANAAAIRSKEQAATMYERLKQIDAMSEACWRALRSYVEANGDVPLPDGRVYGAVANSRDSIRLNDGALAFVREKLGEHADKAVKMSLSKESIKDATKALVGGGKARTALEREVLIGLEERGAVSVSEFTTYEAYKPKKEVA